MIYNGQDDIICNTPSTQNWINNLDWESSEIFFDSDLQPWKEFNTTVGSQKAFNGF